MPETNVGWGDVSSIRKPVESRTEHSIYSAHVDARESLSSRADFDVSMLWNKHAPVARARDERVQHDGCGAYPPTGSSRCFRIHERMK